MCINWEQNLATMQSGALKHKTQQTKQSSSAFSVFLNIFSCCVAMLRTAAAVASVCRACNEGWHIEEATVTLSINSEIPIPVSYTAAATLHFCCTHNTEHTRSLTHTHTSATHTLSLSMWAQIHPKHTLKGYFLLLFFEKLYFASDKWNCIQRTGGIFSAEGKSVESVYFKGFSL